MKEYIEKFKFRLNAAMKDKNVSYVIKGSAFTAIAMGLVQILRFAGGLIIGNYYGPEVHGDLRLVTTLLGTVVILSNFGIKDAMLRLVPEYREKTNLRSAFQIYKKGVVILLGMSILASLLILMITPWLANSFWKVPHLEKIFMLSALFTFPLMLNEMNLFSLRSIFKIRAANFVSLIIVSTRLLTLLVVTFFFFNRDAPIYIYLFILCGFSAFVSGMAIYMYFVKPAKGQTIEPTVNYKKILSISWPMLITYASFVINDKTDTIMIKAFNPEDSTSLGIYAGALSLANIGRMVMVALNTTIQPKFSQLYHSGQIKAIEKIAAKSTKTITLLNVPIFLVLTLGSTFMMGLYGNAYKAGALALSVLAVGQMINTLAGPTAQLLNVTGHHKLFRNIALFGALLNVGMNFILIPQYGILGAAIASATSMASWNIIASIYIKKKFGFFIGYIPFIKIK